jgi:hypothetical protein
LVGIQGSGLVALKWLQIPICGAGCQFFAIVADSLRDGHLPLNSRVTHVARLFHLIKFFILWQIFERFRTPMPHFVRIFVTLANLISGKKLSHECFSR